MDPAQGRQTTDASPSLYADIIETVMSYLVSELPERPHTKALSRCALVCREWCTIARKISFAHIEYIALSEAPGLRELCINVSTGSYTHTSSAPCKLNTFAKHVRSAGVDLALCDNVQDNYDEWNAGGKEFIAFLRASFPPNYQLALRLNYDTMYASHFVDLLSVGGAQNLVELWLRQVTLEANHKELAALFSDESLPSLKVLTLWRTAWRPDRTIKLEGGLERAQQHNNSDNSTDVDDGSNDGHRKVSRSLDVLCFFLAPSYPGSQMFWPHKLFSELHVRTLQMNHCDSNLFWKEVPSMLRALSASLVELDLSYHHLDYEAVKTALPGVTLSALRTLKLKIKQGPMTQIIGEPATEQQVMDILRSIIAPQLQHIDFYISLPTPPVPSEEYMETKGWIHSHLKWDILDRALESLRLKDLSSVSFNFLDRECYKTPENRALELLREHMPRCVSLGLIISHYVLSSTTCRF